MTNLTDLSITAPTPDAPVSPSPSHHGALAVGAPIYRCTGKAARLTNPVDADRDADLMLHWERIRQFTRGQGRAFEFRMRAFHGIAFEDRETGTIDMGPDERRYAEKHQGVSNSWSGD